MIKTMDTEMVNCNPNFSYFIPNTYILLLLGCIFGLIIFILSWIGGENNLPIILSLYNLFTIAAWIYWFLCIYIIHEFIEESTQKTYPVSPGRAVWFHFIPIYGLIWTYIWPGKILKLISKKSGSSVRSNWYGIVFCLCATSSPYMLIEINKLEYFFFNAGLYGILLTLQFASGLHLFSLIKKNFIL